MTEVTIQTSGVFRCCLDSVGCDESGAPFIMPAEGDTDTCEYCGRMFQLTDNCWRPVGEEPEVGK